MHSPCFENDKIFYRMEDVFQTYHVFFHLQLNISLSSRKLLKTMCRDYFKLMNWYCSNTHLSLFLSTYNNQSFNTFSNKPDFHISRCACSVSPHCGERWWNSSSLMAHKSFPVKSWKAFPAWGSRYRCSVHSSHFCTFPVFHSIGSTKENNNRESFLTVSWFITMHLLKWPTVQLVQLSVYFMLSQNKLCSASWT